MLLALTAPKTPRIHNILNQHHQTYDTYQGVHYKTQHITKSWNGAERSLRPHDKGRADKVRFLIE